MKRFQVVPAFFLVLWVAFQGAAFAQSYPSRPIRIMVGFTAGGGTDIAARKLAERLQPLLGQAMIVENRPGAGGAIALQVTARADPDGYTLGVGSSTATAFKIFNKDVTLDLQRDLAPVGKYALGIGMLVVNTKLPVKTVPEFIAYAKANPGKVAYGSPGGTVWLALEAFKQQAGIDMLHVQYKGAADYATALLADQVQLILDNPSTQQGNVDAGKVRFIAAVVKKRLATYPNIPTVGETLPGWDYIIWNALFVPAKTPKAVIDRLTRDMKTVATSDEYKADTLKWSNGGYEADWGTPEDLEQDIARDTKRWADLARAAKVE